MTDVERIALAPGYHIPRLIIGGWQSAQGHSPGSSDRQTLFTAWSQLVDVGCTTFDCADIYTGVEEVIGAFLRGQRAAGVPLQVHTKFVPDRDALPTIDRAYVERIIDRSLRRLGVERLDLVQFHWWDFGVPRHVETARWLDELRLAGKIRHLGVTNFDRPHLEELVEAGVPLVAHQVQYSVLDPRPARGVAAYGAAHDIQLLCYGTLAGGFLSERWIGRESPTGPLENRSLVKYQLVIEECGGWTAFQRLLATLGAIARKHDVGIANVAVRYVLERPHVAAAIIGVRNAAHITDNLRTLAFAPDDEDRARLAAAVEETPGPPGDVYVLERTEGGPHAAIMRYDLNRQAGA